MLLFTARVPRATYRLQLNSDFTFEDARRLVPYLKWLGISDVYVSPIFQASTRSTHGYDVNDFTRISTDLGGREGLDRLGEKLREEGLGLLLDFVPNLCVHGSVSIIQSITPMKTPQRDKSISGKVPLLLLWLIGIPVPVLVVIFLLRGCS